MILVAMAAAPASARDQAIHLFSVSPSQSYTVLRNGATHATLNSTANGALVFSSPTSPGDQFRIFVAGGGATPPSIPDGVAASGDGVGCAHLSWSPNPETDVTLYRVYYGEGSGAYTDSVDATGTAVDVCGLTDGTWYFAVRAHNSTGLLSGLSIEVSASVSNGNAQPPVAPSFIVVSEGTPGCVDVSWNASGDPTVVGYVVDYGTSSVESGPATSYDVTVDAGSATLMEVCGLSSGTYYFAVRSRNHLGMLSSYSPEMPVSVASTPVLVAAFDAAPEGHAVALEWEIFTDELIQGLRVIRGDDGQVGQPISGLLSPSETRYVDQLIEPDTRYSYTLAVIGEDGSETRSMTVSVRTNPLALDLEQNYPNPFNPSTTISYILPVPGSVSLTVHDVRGRLVATLAEGPAPSGRSTIMWDGFDTDGRRVASGTYFYRIESPSGVRTRKMVLLK